MTTEIQTKTDAPVRKPWLLRVAQIAWVLIVGIAIGMFFAGVPLRYAELQVPCTGAPVTCSNRLLPTEAELAQLEADGVSPQTYALILTGSAIFFAMAYLAIALLIFVRQSNNAGALIISLALVLLGTSNAMWEALAQQYPIFQPAVRFLFFVGLFGFALIFATFPNGRVVPRAIWIVLVLWGIYAFLDTLSTNAATQALVTDELANLAWYMMFLGGIAAQLYRYKWVSTTVEREQTKWVVMGLVVLVSFVMLAFSIFVPDPSYFQGASVRRIGFQLFTVTLAFLCIPVPIAIAILRYRLWDIDVIIRRTVTYAVVVALLLVVYFGSVILLQQLFANVTGQRSEIITIISTLVIAALFVPLRNRIQNAIDKRFNRQRYNAQQVLQKFAVTVRDETDIDKLTAELVNVVNETMEPRNVSVWLKQEKRGK